MENMIIPFLNETMKMLKFSRASIFPFTELPGKERAGDADAPSDTFNAAELFSLFTADIIKQEIIFTR